MGKESWNDTQCILAFAIISALVAVIFVWMFRPPTGDAGSIAVLNTLVGALIGMSGLIANYYFSSSKGSQAKDTTIQNMAASVTGTGTGTGNGEAAKPPAPEVKP